MYSTVGGACANNRKREVRPTVDGPRFNALGQSSQTRAGLWWQQDDIPLTLDSVHL